MARDNRISVYNSEALQAIILSMRVLDRDTKKIFRREVKAKIEPEWKKGLAENALTRTEFRVLVDTGRVAVSDQNVTLSSATVGKPLSGGLNPKQLWYAIEFGADDQNKKHPYERKSRRGGSHTVNRRTSRQLRPRNEQGYVVFPTFANLVPRVAALWTQTIARGIFEALESGNK